MTMLVDFNQFRQWMITHQDKLLMDLVCEEQTLQEYLLKTVR